MTIIVTLVMLLALFALAYVSRRRFGVLGLALTAGALLARQMTKDLSWAISYYDLPVEPLTTVSAASIALILTPALVLLFSGPSYKTNVQAVVGAVMFALMAMLLILGPLATSLQPDAFMQPVFAWVARNNSVLLAGMVALAVVDTWMVHNHSPHDDKKKK